MLSSEPSIAQRMSSIASMVFGDSHEWSSVMVRLTAEKSQTGQSWLKCIGCAWQLQPTVEILRHSPSKIQGELCSAGTRITLYIASSSRPGAVWQWIIFDQTRPNPTQPILNKRFWTQPNPRVNPTHGHFWTRLLQVNLSLFMYAVNWAQPLSGGIGSGVQSWETTFKLVHCADYKCCIKILIHSMMHDNELYKTDSQIMTQWLTTSRSLVLRSFALLVCLLRPYFLPTFADFDGDGVSATCSD